MDLICTNSNLWNQTVDVARTIYSVGPTGLTTDISDEHARILLLCPGWKSIPVVQTIQSTPISTESESTSGPKATYLALSITDLMKLAKSKKISVVNKSRDEVITALVALDQTVSVAQEPLKEVQDKKE